MTPNFQYQQRVFQDIMFGANLVILAQICEWIIVQKERERLSLSAFLGTEDIVVHIVHTSHVIKTYTLE